MPYYSKEEPGMAKSKFTPEQTLTCFIMAERIHARAEMTVPHMKAVARCIAAVMPKETLRRLDTKRGMAAAKREIEAVLGPFFQSSGRPVSTSRSQAAAALRR